jgi:hypothetical protein
MNHARTDLVCRLALLHVAGAADVTYDDLVMVAGWGTSFVFHPTKPWLIFCPPEDPGRVEEALARATGWRWAELGQFHGRPEEAWQALTAALDAGRPVVGDFRDNYVFAGYRAAADPAGRQVCHLGGWEDDGWWTWERFTAWCAEFGTLRACTAPVERAEPRAVALAVLRAAVAFAPGDDRKTVPQFADGSYGLPGMEAYAALVADAGRDPDTFDGAWLGCYGINRQHDPRVSAERWFRARAALFGEPARGHILEAADHYAAACAAWRDYEKQLGQGRGQMDLADAKAVWREPASRAAGAAAIRRAAACERAAVAALEQALQALTSPAGP